MYDINKVREDFPILAREVYKKPLVYLDNAATTQKPLCVLDAMRDDKLEACGLYIKNLEAEETAILHEERKLNTRRKALQAKRERLMDYVLTDMMTDGKELQTARLTMKPAKNPPSVVVDDVEALPIGYRRVKVEADKAELRKALKAGRVIPGARLSEGPYRLAVR